MLFKNRTYSLRKSKHIFFQTLKLYNKKKELLLSEQKQQIKKNLELLQQNIIDKDKAHASDLAKTCESYSKSSLKKTSFEQTKTFVFQLIFALILAIILRQMWFEFYEIPTGSMRPTLKEKDRLVVSKDQYGINIPLKPSHFYFDPSQVKRGGIVVFTGANMDIFDVDTRYFYIFPGKKQYIKRMIGKPGDTLYFYGGNIYGIDEEGHDISAQLQLPQLSKIDHVPFIYFEGKALTPQTPNHGVYSPVVICQMNEPVAKLDVLPGNKVHGELLRVFQKDDVKKYDNLWGFKNYATARLLTANQFEKINNSAMATTEKGALYLELTHNPSLSTASLERDYFGRLRPTLGLSRSYIPLNESHLKTLMGNLYTARFIVEKGGRIYRYGYQNDHKKKQPFAPKNTDIPPGTYEFYDGIAYQIYWQGISKKLPKSHPIYQFSLERAQLFFNLGIEFDTRFSPETLNQPLTPSRFAFFRNQDLYVMGTKLLYRTDPVLKEFVKNEHLRQIRSPVGIPYTPFIDHGAPVLEDGKIDKKFIQSYGIKVPSKSYLVLGDNYAMSADSRDFGFVPQGNLNGVAEAIFWPFGDRFGSLNQPGYDIFTPSRIIVWILVVITITVWTIVHRRLRALPKTID